tara:strand:+ start:588 stop:758 length:171 start_codon:yes stop_codon:yes gene_type:complete
VITTAQVTPNLKASADPVHAVIKAQLANPGGVAATAQLLKDPAGAQMYFGTVVFSA